MEKLKVEQINLLLTQDKKCARGLKKNEISNEVCDDCKFSNTPTVRRLFHCLFRDNVSDGK